MLLSQATAFEKLIQTDDSLSEAVLLEILSQKRSNSPLVGLLKLSCTARLMKVVTVRDQVADLVEHLVRLLRVDFQSLFLVILSCSSSIEQ